MQDEKAAKGSILAAIRFQLVASRPGFWITHIWFYGLPLAGKNYFVEPSFWIGLAYVTFPMGHLLYAWNDLGDAETDRINPRKGGLLFGSAGDSVRLASLPSWIAGIQLVAIGPLVWFGGTRMLVWLALAVAVNVLYNGPLPTPNGRGLKSVPGLDVLMQAGYLLVFVFSCWINEAPGLPLATLVFSALFAMHSHLFGQIMDIEPDREAGRRSTAVAIGVLPSKWLACGLLVVESTLIWTSYRDPWIAGFLLCAALAFAVDAACVYRERPYPQWLIVVTFLFWNAAALGSIHLLWVRGTLAGL